MAMLHWRADGKEIFFPRPESRVQRAARDVGRCRDLADVHRAAPKLLFKLPGPLGGNLREHQPRRATICLCDQCPRRRHAMTSRLSRAASHRTGWVEYQFRRPAMPRGVALSRKSHMGGKPTSVPPVRYRTGTAEQSSLQIIDTIRTYIGGEGGIRSRRSLPHQRFRPDPKPSIRQIHSKPEYQVQNRYSAIPQCASPLNAGARSNLTNLPAGPFHPLPPRPPHLARCNP